ncbi:MAG: hypothetical protein PVJ67_01470 [Candidatus Pacearchaeota archaeon]|jgi:hypothetical protein
MKPEINFEDWMKVDLIVGEVVEIDEENIKVDVGEKVLELKQKINVKKGKKIIVGIKENNLVVPLVNDSVISPEKDVKVGMKVS